VLIAAFLSLSALIIGGIYYLSKSFVSESTCKARQDCIEGEIKALREVMITKLEHIEKLIDKNG